MTNRELIKRLEAIKESDPEAIAEAIEKIKLLDKTAAEVIELAISGMRRGQS